MNTINPYFLIVPLEPITGLADDDDAVRQYGDVDICDEQQARTVIQRLIVPHMATMPRSILDNVQLTYRYYLSRDESRWDNVLNSVLPPFDTPADPRRFFEILYEACFGTSRYQLPDSSDYHISTDANDVLKLYERERRQKGGQS